MTYNRRSFFWQAQTHDCLKKPCIILLALSYTPRQYSWTAEIPFNHHPVERIDPGIFDKFRMKAFATATPMPLLRKLQACGSFPRMKCFTAKRG